MTIDLERDAHLFGPGPKRILSLDGGGTLGIIELAFLERVEALLREHYGDPQYRLCQAFDLIGGTSTGAIIASLLALGRAAAEVTEMYLDLAPVAFRRRSLAVPMVTARFDSAPLAGFLHELFGDRTLQSPDIRTGLAIMTRRFDTSSAWLISNNPKAPYWEDSPDRSFIGNRHYLLVDMVRASTAAPGLFSPLWLQIVEGEPPGLFVDGALSSFNNPSLALFMHSQARAFGLQWKMGPDNLIVLSLGAGYYRRGLAPGEKPPTTAGLLALRAVTDTFADSQGLTLALLQWLGEAPQPWTINSEIGDLSSEMLAGHALLRFQRYDMPLESDWLRKNLGRKFSDKELLRFRHIDDPTAMRDLFAMASEVAATQVQLAHFL